MSNSDQGKTIGRGMTIRRKIIAATIGAFILTLSVGMSHTDVQAAPKNFTKDALQGYCNEKGGVYSTGLNGFYSCILPDGTIIVCGGAIAGCDTIDPTRSVPGKPVPPNVSSDLILLNEQDILKKLNDLTSQVKSLITGQNALANQVSGLELACTTPDLLPMPAAGTTGPEGFCQRDIEGKLHVQIYNQGGADALASTTLVSFRGGTAGALTTLINLATPALPAFGGSAELVVNIPSNCFNPTTGNCNFNIAADLNNAVAETDEANNSVPGVCGAQFQ